MGIPELAERAGVSNSTLWYAQANKRVNDLLLYKLCGALGVEPQSVDPSIGQRVNSLGHIVLGECARRCLTLADLAREADIKPGDLYRIVRDPGPYPRGKGDIRRTRQLTSYLNRYWLQENGHNDTELKDRVQDLREALFAY